MKGIQRERETGSLLIEVIIALSLLTVGILSFMSTFQSVARATDEVNQQDRVRSALEDIVERLRGTEASTLYATFNDAHLEVPHLQGASGGLATAEITCFVDETKIPPEFGPIYDLDGQAGLSTMDCSTSYKILPVRITIRYGTSYGPVAKSLYMVFGG